MEFHFFKSNDFVLFENWKSQLVTEQNCVPKGWVFCISESWKIKIGREKVMEKSLNFITQFLYEPWMRVRKHPNETLHFQLMVFCTIILQCVLIV